MREPGIVAMTGSIRTSRWPIFLIRSNRSLPSIESCRGTSPSHTAKSRPLRKFSRGRQNAWIAIADVGPIPGMVFILRAFAFLRAPFLIFKSSEATSILMASIWHKHARTTSATSGGAPSSFSLQLDTNAWPLRRRCGRMMPSGSGRVGGYGKARHSGWFAAFFPIAAILLFAEARKGPMNGIPRSPVTSIDARIKHPKSP